MKVQCHISHIFHFFYFLAILQISYRFGTMTYVFLSFRVSIKTLKNSNNAVLPEWYLVTPLLKNHDEVFAFGGLLNLQYCNTFSNQELSVYDIVLYKHTKTLFVFRENRIDK